jgi:hypothetical protein
MTKRDAHPVHLFAGGAVAGVAVLFRPIALILPLLVIFTPTLASQPTEERIKAFGVFLAGLVLAISPWLLRNYVEFGRVSITSNTGVNFWIGNHAEANGSYSYPEINPLSGITDEFERSDEGFRLGVGFWISHPGEALRTTGKKLAHFFGIDYWILMSHHYNPDWSAYKKAVHVYKEIPTTSMVLTHLPVIVISILALFCAAALPSEERERWMFILLLLSGWIMLHLLFFGSARVRFPLHPLLILAAVHGWGMLRSGTWRLTPYRRAILAFGMLLLIGGWVAEVWILASAETTPIV